MEFVQVRLLLNRSDPFPEKIVRERLTWSSAFYGERVLDYVYHCIVSKNRKTGGLRYGCK